MSRINHDEADAAIADGDEVTVDPPSYYDVLAEHGIEED
jgi:hypothetical protein